MSDIEPVPAPPANSNADPRWRFIRDVAVFEMKLALNNLHNFFQIPLTLAVAVFDLFVKGRQEGERFYKLVEMGRTIDDFASRHQARPRTNNGEQGRGSLTRLCARFFRRAGDSVKDRKEAEYCEGPRPDRIGRRPW